MSTPSECAQPSCKPKAYSYLRFSTPEQMKGDSFRRQTQMAEEYASRYDLELDNMLTFQDLGVSAFRGKNAETGRLGDFLEALRSGLVAKGSFLLVESLDRISRQAARKALRVLEDIVDEGVVVVTLNDGKKYDSASLNDEPLSSLMMALIIFIRANEESATKSRRLKSAWEAKRATATSKPLTALGPAWLRLDSTTRVFELIEERAAVVRRIFAMSLDGVGQNKIAVALNRESIPTFGDAQMWHRSYVAKILGNPAVIGTYTPHLLEHGHGRRIRKPLEPIRDYFPAAVDEESFRRVQAQRIGRSPVVRGEGVNSLLAGLARCPVCGGTMTRITKGPEGGPAYLVCIKAKQGKGCVYRAIRQRPMESAILQSAEQLLGTVPSGDVGLDNALEATEAQIFGLHDAAENLVDALASGPSIAISLKLRELENELEQMERHRRELLERQVAISGPLLARRLSELGEALAAQPINRPIVNSLFRQVLDSVVVDYRSGDLVLKWKHGGESQLTYAWGDLGEGGLSAS